MTEQQRTNDLEAGEKVMEQRRAIWSAREVGENVARGRAGFFLMNKGRVGLLKAFGALLYY